MGLALTQVITEDRASGAQIIDGSLNFDGESLNSYLSKTFGSAGTEETWTVSVWFRIDDVSNQNHLFSSGANSSNRAQVTVESDGSLNCEFQSGGSVQSQKITNRRFRDSTGWYHLVVAVDTNDGTAEDRMKIYINGVRETSFSTNTLFSSGDVTQWMKAIEHNIGKRTYSTDYFDGRMSQFYCIDGQQLEPTEFGFTDGLTNTWRPKKYTGTYGSNGFYLPLDGNSPIGRDKSGNENDFTPVNIRSSAALDKATGALPILNTVNGGRFATVGVRTDSLIGAGVTCELALPFAGNVNDVSHLIDNKTTQKTTTANGGMAYESTINRFYYYDGCYKSSGANSTNVTVGSVGDFNFLHDKTTPFTIEFWFDGDAVTNSDAVFDTSDAGASNHGVFIGFLNSHLRFIVSNGTTNETFDPEVDHSTGQWYHYAVTFDGSRVRIFVDGVKKVDSTYSLSGSTSNHTGALTIFSACVSTDQVFDGYMSDVRVYNGIAKYTEDFIVGSSGAVHDENIDILPDTPSGVAYSSALTKITDGSVSFDGNGDYLNVAATDEFTFGTGDFTIETFIYHSTLNSSGNTIIDFRNASDNTDAGALWKTSGGQFGWYVNGSNRVNGETVVVNKWYHLAVVRNSGTTSLYVDGISVGSFSDSFNYATKSSRAFIGALADGTGTLYFDGFISNLRINKGTALYTSNFTPPSALTNVANTVLLCCQTYTSATAAAVSPGSITANGNTQGNTFNPFTTDINAVRGQESLYASLNPVSFRGNGSINDGNLRMAANSSGDCSAAVTLQIPTDKKIYLEAQHNVTAGAGNRAQIGVVNVNVDTGANSRPGGQAGGWAYDFSTSSGNAGAYDEGTRTAGPAVDNGDICMWCIDLSAGLMWAGKNGQWFSTGNPSTGSGSVITGIPDTATSLKVSVDGGATNRSELIYNFGQKPFKYNPPDGFEPLCLANLTNPTSAAAVRPETYVGIHTYVGTGSEHDIPNAFGFDPDFLWTRRSDGTGDRHNWYDKVRGDDGTRMYVICPDATASQATRTESTTAMVKSSQWPRHGFRVGTNGQTNTDGALYTAFGLKAGGAAVSNSDGSITTQVSASPESGFSIIKYTGNQTTGASIGHGLNQAPEMLIFKSLAEDRNWLIWHKDLNAGAGDYYLYFSVAKRAQDTRANRPLKDSGCVTDTTIILGLDSEVNHNNDMICYAFHSVPGVVKVGRYDGNGSTTDGPFVDCGFRPKFVIAKNYAGGSETNWFVKDVENAKFNPAQFTLYLNGSDARVNNFPIDFYSNGFKMKDDNALINESGSNYIYIAWADTPTNNLFGGQANAR